MRLRRKPWIDEAILDYASFVHLEHCEEHKGKWRELFEDPDKPLWVELGTGKGNFISQMAQLHPEANFIGIEIQVGVLYYAGKKCAAAEVNNVHLLRFDVARLEEIFAPGEVSRFFINFCDPWPKKRHAKRRLTYRDFSTAMPACWRKAAVSILNLTTRACSTLRWKNLRNGSGSCRK